MSPFSLKNPHETNPRGFSGSQASGPLHCSAAVKAQKKAEAEQLRHAVSTGASKGPEWDDSCAIENRLGPGEGGLRGVLQLVRGRASLPAKILFKDF